VKGLVDLRAQPLADVYRIGGWTYGQLAAETGLSLERVLQLIDCASGWRAPPATRNAECTDSQTCPAL
jgi:hypothetical protein